MSASTPPPSPPAAEANAATNADTADAPTDQLDLEDSANFAAQLEAVTAERNDYLDQLQRQRAEFQNYRRRVTAERQQQVSAGVSRVVESLLPVLDGCDAAAAQGHDEVTAVGQALMVALSKVGLERIPAVGQPFDPTQHEAVTFEQVASADSGLDGRASDGAGDAVSDTASDSASAGDDDAHQHDRQIVMEELRSGFRFDGRVLRAAMVKVRTG